MKSLISSWKSPRLATLMLLSLFFVVGCDDDDDDGVLQPTTDTAQVRVVHLSPDAGPVDVYVDDALTLEDVTFNGVSEYLSVAAGQHDVAVTPANDAQTRVIDVTVTLEADKAYTVVARGLLADSDVNPILLEDDLQTMPAMARVRFVHASPDAPPVDITLPDGSILFGNVPFGEADESYLSVPAGNYDLQVRVAGTETVALSFGDVGLQNGTVYTVYARGLLADGSISALVTVDDPADGSASLGLDPAEAQVRVAHLSPDAPNVDVYLDDALVTGLVNVPFEAISAYLDVSAKTSNVKVKVTGTDNTVIDADLTFLPSSKTTVAATGLVGQDDLAPIVIDDAANAPAAGNVHVRFIHTSPDAPTVDVQVAGGDPVLFDAVDFREARPFASLAAGTYDLEVALDSSGAVALDLSGTTLPSGSIITVFAVGLAGDETLDALLDVQ